MSTFDPFAPVMARCNLERDLASGELVVRIPEHANIAPDTVVRQCREGRGDVTALVVERADGVVERHSYAELDAASDRLAVGLSRRGVVRASR